MLINYSYLICPGIMWIMLIVILFSAYAYIANQRRDKDDPKKREYNPYAILIAPIAIPLLITGLMLVFVIKALLFAIFLVVFTIALVGLRKPFIFVLLDRIAKWIGEPMLKVNSYLIRLVFRNDPAPA